MSSIGEKTALTLAALLVISFVINGCKQKAGDEGTGVKSRIVEAITGSDEPPALPPEAEEFVSSEFSGLDIDVTASGVSDVYLDLEGQDLSSREAKAMDSPSFTVRTPYGDITVLTGDSAVVHPAKKVVIFGDGATVNGPRDNVLECSRLTWNYERDELVAEDGFTLLNGRGITTGDTLRTDTGFRRISVN